ncbi:hypothetical protein HYH02_000770 [Chlamydomonas schloesseri]|uniref:Uncharacterized protein n=1 Tax=Chlamydomonas schloesseri TaxID=2026947 RepID=A0A836BCY8_9CHLO|nr:hypothetical protein HYH02_000770 [Chlamydomonas schloesseri]|eukprot:KAG2454942.1 hypothetical protein HYH02_000770 [Chlamydomonas schloesseri]
MSESAEEPQLQPDMPDTAAKELVPQPEEPGPSAEAEEQVVASASGGSKAEGAEEAAAEPEVAGELAPPTAEDAAPAAEPEPEQPEQQQPAVISSSARWASGLGASGRSAAGHANADFARVPSTTSSARGAEQTDPYNNAASTMDDAAPQADDPALTAFRSPRMVMDTLAVLRAATEDDVVAQVPRYAAPSIASSLPSYRNGEQDFIFRTFAVGNYDMLRHLPATIREQQVHASRTARQDATRTFLLPGLLGTQLRHRNNPDNQQGLFSTFEYIPSKYSLAAEIAAKERVASEATRLAVGKGKEFTPTIASRMHKNEDFEPGRGFIYLSGPEEDTQDMQLSHRSHHAAAHVNPAFVPAGGPKLAAEVPTRLMATTMMKRLKRTLEADWEGAVISIFENEHDCWVVCFQEATVDSLEGLAAYMNVFIRSNPLATELKLNKVVEFWGNTPGDGCAYYVMRPPWVANDRLQTFFTLHPEEKDYRTSFPIVLFAQQRAARNKDSSDGTQQQQLAADAELRLGGQQLSLKSLHSIPSGGGAGSSTLPSARSAGR